MTITTQSIFYHLFPLGACGCPNQNDFSSEPINRIREIETYLDHIQSLGCNALLLGPVFESSSHGYDTADYYHLDRRLGRNADLAALSAQIHDRGMSLVLDGVFNHVGRNFWAFRDLQANGQASAYKDWFFGLRFDCPNPMGDPFSYDCWQGNFDLVNLNLENPDVRNHLFGAVSQWKEDYQIDGLRLDAADALNKGFIKALRQHCKSLDPDFWLMAELIHGDYRGWVNPEMADASTSYELYKSSWSAFKDHNSFELSYSLNRQFGPEGLYRGLKTQFNFLDNHDVSRIANILNEKEQLEALYLLLYCQPGIPALYYGSEFEFEAVKTQNDWALRPPFPLQSLLGENRSAQLRQAIRRFADLRQSSPALQDGDCQVCYTSSELIAFTRSSDGQTVLVALNNGNTPQSLSLSLPEKASWKFRNGLTGDSERFVSKTGEMQLALGAYEGQVWISAY